MNFMNTLRVIGIILNISLRKKTNDKFIGNNTINQYDNAQSLIYRIYVIGLKNDDLLGWVF